MSRTFEDTSCCCLPHFGVMAGRLGALTSFYPSRWSPSSDLGETPQDAYNNTVDRTYSIVLFVMYLLGHKLKFLPFTCANQCDKTTSCESVNFANEFVQSVSVILENFIAITSLGNPSSIKLNELTLATNSAIRSIYNAYWILVQQLPNADKYYVDVDKFVAANKTGIRFVPIKCFVALDLNALTLERLNSTLLALQGPISFGGNAVLYSSELVD